MVLEEGLEPTLLSEPDPRFYSLVKSSIKMVLEEGLEPTLLSEPDPKSGASANFAIRATLLNAIFRG